ncbi:hypothetical protein LX32DRAFT_634405 [Colletotrichum zoysiae]|uniref:Uncharacterized protein n=1 Tax=Colletotrichum zoysiae TaxID=1216348 RepID=A0AAD9HTZ1_9PEZI|nr:hypothetical protein LX32DRAFT_634405 [Colletotrichum zoysiae]
MSARVYAAAGPLVSDVVHFGSQFLYDNSGCDGRGKWGPPSNQNHRFPTVPRLRPGKLATSYPTQAQRGPAPALASCLSIPVTILPVLISFWKRGKKGTKKGERQIGKERDK